MELHSYAKRRSSKKWTIEQKRRLVEARIAYDGIFSRKPATCLTTWKKIVTLSKLDDFNVSFVRKQWSNMVAKYKQYKHSRLGNITPNGIDEELLRKVSQEWEFFYPIHCFMSRKMANLHSYALTQGRKQKQSSSNVLTQQQQDENNASLASQLETMLAYNNGSSPEIKPGQNIAMFSSDTNDDYAAAETISSEIRNVFEATPKKESVEEDGGEAGCLDMQIQNTDHDFYSKKSPKRENLFGDDSDTELPAVVAMHLEATTHNQTLEQGIKNEVDTMITVAAPHSIGFLANNSKNNSQAKKVQIKRSNKRNVKEAAASSKDKPSRVTQSKGKRRKKQLSERDKYYRHKRRFNRRLERRFDTILNVFGQIVRAEYPSIDVRPILGDAADTPVPHCRWDDDVNGGFETGMASSSGASTDAETTSSNGERAESQAESTAEE